MKIFEDLEVVVETRYTTVGARLWRRTWGHGLALVARVRGRELNLEARWRTAPRQMLLHGRTET